LVDEELFYSVVLELYSDDHGIILLVVDAAEIIVRKGNWKHAASVVRVGYVVNRLEVTEVFLSSRGGGFAIGKAF